MNNLIEVACTAQLKQEEERVRQVEIRDLEKRIDKLLLQIEWLQGEKREKKKRELIEMKKKIGELQDQQMNEVKFWGYVMDEEGAG